MDQQNRSVIHNEWLQIKTRQFVRYKRYSTHKTYKNNKNLLAT